MKALLLCLLLTGCAGTRVYSPVTGRKTFDTNANFESMKLGRDGSLTMTRVDHSTPQDALARTVTARANGIGAIVTAVAGSTLLH